MPPADAAGDTPSAIGAAPRHTNRLANETSPYLLQHAHNPVDWHPWGVGALERARASDLPIFLSIGYAACHWCHVMERESFEDEATAAELNAGFVAIKVDREERPDLDAIYMDAVQAMTGHGGWPMSVFLTPDGRPFYGGTYFPDQPRHGMPSFRQVLTGVSEAWQQRRADVEASATRLANHIDSGQAGPGRSTATSIADAPDTNTTPSAANAPSADDAAVTAILEATFDARHGGWGGAPKFPQAMTLEFLLRENLRSGEQPPLTMALRTLDAMADGGIHDQLAGGFARYATDAAWLVPHFEKMLYDNAQLARVYLNAWHATGEPRYRHVARQTLDFVARDLRVADPVTGRPAAFASSLDADTAGREGATYVWSAAQIREALGSDAPLFEAACGVTPRGNWEGQTILSRVRPEADLAADFGLTVEEVDRRLARARDTLLRIRDRRPQPARDDKVLTAWNGLMVGAFADAGRVLADDGMSAIATAASDFLMRELRTPQGRWLRSWKDGRAQHAAGLEDHTHLADGFLALYEATLDERWFVAARDLADLVLERFADPGGGFFDTADDAETLITRPRSLGDNALPSGNAMAVQVLLRLAALTADQRYRDAAERTLMPMVPLATRHPTAFAQWLLAGQLADRPIDEVAIVGDPAAADTRALLEVVRERPRLGLVLAVSADPDSSVVPLLHARAPIDGRATAYVCRSFACQRPVTEPDALRAQLAAADARPTRSP